MKRFKKFGAIIFLSTYLFIGFGLAVPSKSLAADPQFTPQIGIPGSEFQQGAGATIGTPGTNAVTGEAVMRSDLLARYIAAFYNWGFGIVGVIAVLMLMAAGVIWLTSGGDSGKIGNAKTMIEGALMGSALLVGSWFLLNTINPNLTNLPALEMVVIEPIVLGCCQYDNKAEMTTDKNCKKNNGQFLLNSWINGLNTKCESPGCCINKSNDGKIIDCYNSAKTNCDSNTFITSTCNIAITNLSNTSSYCPDMCASKSDGDLCYNEMEFSTISYCYKGICWRGAGKEGEPCGNDGGKCVSNSDAPFYNFCGKGSLDLKRRDCSFGYTCCSGTTK